MDVTEYQKRIAAIVDQDASAPTAGGDDWNLRLSYLNQAQDDWARSYEWPTLFKEINTLTSQATGNVTISLASDFRKMDGYLTIADGNGSWEYPQIDAVKKKQRAPSDRYFYILGDPSGEYNMVINPTDLGSGASISYSYWSSAGTLASPADISMCPNPEYLVHQATYYIWQSRDDGRFQDERYIADRILSQMLEFEVTKGSSYDDRVQTYEESHFGFRLGKD
jgi:hypothetical protein